MKPLTPLILSLMILPHPAFADGHGKPAHGYGYQMATPHQAPTRIVRQPRPIRTDSRSARGCPGKGNGFGVRISGQFLDCYFKRARPGVTYDSRVGPLGY